MAKNNYPVVNTTSPKGRAVWPHLHAPDTEFDADGVYTTGQTLDREEALPLVEKIDAVILKTKKAVKEEKGKAKDAPYLPYEENDDGTYTFKFKMKASGTRQDGSRWTMRPKLFDAQGRLLEEGLKIGGGSLIKVNFDIAGYNAPFGVGATLRLNAVQVLELQTWGGASAEDFGFGEEEGFSADEADASVFTGEDTDADLDDEAEDDPLADGDF